MWRGARAFSLKMGLVYSRKREGETENLRLTVQSLLMFTGFGGPGQSLAHLRGSLPPADSRCPKSCVGPKPPLPPQPPPRTSNVPVGPVPQGGTGTPWLKRDGLQAFSWLGWGGSGSLRSAPSFLAPSPFPLGSLPNPLTLRVTSPGPGTRCFIFSLPPPPLGSSLKCSEGDPWAEVLSLPLWRPLFPALFHSLSLLGVSLYCPLTLHSQLRLRLRLSPRSVNCSQFLLYFSIKNLELSVSMHTLQLFLSHLSSPVPSTFAAPKAWDCKSQKPMWKVLAPVQPSWRLQVASWL